VARRLRRASFCPSGALSGAATAPAEGGSVRGGAADLLFLRPFI
jgi:hypothetical protein